MQFQNETKNNLLSNNISISNYAQIHKNETKDNFKNNNMNLADSLEKADKKNLISKVNESIECEDTERRKTEKNCKNEQPNENIITSITLEEEFKNFYKNIHFNNDHYHSNSYKNLRYALNQGSLEIIKENASNENSKYSNPNISKDKSIEIEAYKKNKEDAKSKIHDVFIDLSHVKKRDKINFDSYEDELKQPDNCLNKANSIDSNYNLNFYNSNGRTIDESSKKINISNINNSYNANNFSNSDNNQFMKNLKDNMNSCSKESLSVTDIGK